MIYGESSILIYDVSNRGRTDLIRRFIILGIVAIALNTLLNCSLIYAFYFFCLSIR